MELDVVVVGAGPVGLMLACELRLCGARVMVLEREEEVPRARYGSMGARAVNAPTVHALHLRGLLPAVKDAALMWIDRLPEAPPDSNVGEPGVFVGQFAGIGIRADRLRRPGPGYQFLGAGVLSQGDLQDILEQRASQLGVHVRRGVTADEVIPDVDTVNVSTSRGQLRTPWLIGADGGRSTVRTHTGFDFVGVDPVFTGRQALVELDDPSKLVTGGWQNGENGSYTVGGWADGTDPMRVHTIEFAVPHTSRDAPVTAGEIEASLRRVSRTDVSVTRLHLGSRYTDTTRQATTYRKGRVLLCGDAAHVHSPAGGQGMNLGMGDAVNLGWKLGLVVRGAAPESLLDTYTAERHPIGDHVQRWSMAQTALNAAPGARGHALRAVMTDLLNTPDGATQVVSTLGGDHQHYDIPGDHPLLGHRTPDLTLDGGTTLAEHLRSGQAVLLAAGLSIADAAAGWRDRLTIATTTTPTGLGTDTDEPTAVLIRPDGYLAWAGSTVDGRAGLASALTDWLGPPTVPSTD